MKRQTILSLCLGLLLVACAPQNNQVAPVTATQSAEATRIDTDQSTGAIRFIVNGQEQASIDGSGLHVRKNVDADQLVLRGDESLPGNK